VKIIAVDPGIRVLGVAIGDDSGRIEWAALVKSPAPLTVRRGAAVSAMAWELARVLQGRTWEASAVEWPKQYDGAGSFADRQDISALSALAGGAGVIVASRALAFEFTPEPFEWKGQVPKDVHNQRTMARLTLADRERIEWPARKDLAHNVIDAVGLLLWAGEEIGRAGRRAERPRG